MKRSGGRRFYRPEDIEFLRGIKILLHREKHPIKDVQKLIRIRGAQSVIDLGRSKEIASRPRDIKETELVPKRIKPVAQRPAPREPQTVPKPEIIRPVATPAQLEPTPEASAPKKTKDVDDLKSALGKLRSLKSRWETFE